MSGCSATSTSLISPTRVCAILPKATKPWKTEQETMMVPQSDFEIGEADPNIIVIVDLNKGGRTVTNDAEAVVDYLVNEFGYGPAIDQHRIIYDDGHGRWDG